MEQNCTLDFLAEERRERAIQLHMVLSLFVGMLLGVLGALLSSGDELLYAIYNPYAYVLLTVIVGRSAAGFGWALLASALATFGPIIVLLAAATSESGTRFMSLGDIDFGGDGVALNLTLVALASVGVLSHFTRRDGLGGDLAGGALAGFVAIDGISKTLPGGTPYIPGFWPWGTLIVTVLLLGLPLSLRRRCGWARSALVALIIPSAYFVFVAGL